MHVYRVNIDVHVHVLLARVTKDEVLYALRGMPSFNSPGADGFQPFFFKQYWHVVGDEVWKVVHDAFLFGSFDPFLAETLIVLIPKEDQPVRMKEFRPISLCNVLYKLITKVLVNRMRSFMPNLICPMQSGFVPGRSPQDNSIVAQEEMHYMRTSKAKKGFLAFKVDLEKAYDRVDWRYLEFILSKFGFPDRIISLIMFCVTSSSLSILWNGVRLPSVIPARGLRQGDPMSPYLFILCMEALSHLIKNQVEEGNWQPIHVSRGGLGISHLLFADDVLLFTKASASQVRLVSKTLQVFCRSSGLKVNVYKSRAMCSALVSRQRRDLFTSISSIRFASDLGKYLGFPLLSTKPKRRDLAFIIDKLNLRLASWKGKLLNKAGRLTLAKSVLASIPVYCMQSLWIPSTICEDIDRVTRRFIWSKRNFEKGLHLVHWDLVTKSKAVGGLAIRKAREVNISLLGKLLWALFHEPYKLWVQVLANKYLQDGSIFDVGCSSNSSHVWKAIHRTSMFFKDGFRLRLGDGSASLWYDNWTSVGPLYRVVDFVHISDSQMKVRDC